MKNFEDDGVISLKLGWHSCYNSHYLQTYTLPQKSAECNQQENH